MDHVVFCDDDFWEQKRHDSLTVDDFWKDTDNTYMDECLNDFLHHAYSKPSYSYEFFDGYAESYTQDIQKKEKELLKNGTENRQKQQQNQRKRVVERMCFQRTVDPPQKKTKTKKFKRNKTNGQFTKSTKYTWVSISELNKKKS